MFLCKNVLSGGVSNRLGGQIYVTYCYDYKSFTSKQLIGALTASGMPTMTKLACFCYVKGKIDFGNLLLSDKMLKNLPLEQDNFSFTYFQLDWGGWQ